MKTKWKVYYSDGAAIDSEMKNAYDIERRADVQVIIQESAAHNWVTLSGKDYYYYDKRGDDFRWWGGDIFGLHHYLLQSGGKAVLFGTEIDKRRFNEIFERARAEFGDKQVFEPRERRP